MAQYELSNDPVLLEQAERLCSLEGRAFPTLVVSWESRMLGQDWDTVLVQDYTIALPPLEHGSSFNEVRISAFTGPVPTKFLYFGTELNAAAPRTVPEMENTLTAAGVYQEYRLTGESCPVPYLELISTTPRSMETARKITTARPSRWNASMRFYDPSSSVTTSPRSLPTST